MTRKSFKWIMLAALCVIFGCAGTNFAQTDEPIAGGYRTAAVSDLQIITATNFCRQSAGEKTKAKIKLVAINNAARQVVAGMNYKLCLNVEVIEKGRKIAVPQIVEAIVFLNLKQKLALTSWTIAACSEKMPESPSPTN